MGLDEQVIGIGPFSPDIAESLEYGAQRYAEVEPGATVVTTVFLAATSGESHDLAEAFGVGAFEMGKHHLNAQKVSIEKLRSLGDERGIADFLNLREHGFEFYYMPNG